MGVLVLGVTAIFLNTHLTLGVSDTYSVTSQEQWEAGEYYPGTVDTKTSAGDISINPGAGGTWSTETPGFITDEGGYGLAAYRGNYYGADLTTDGTYVYIIQGNYTPYLIQYNPELNTFKFLANAPTSFEYGGSIEYYNGALYATNGGLGDENGEATKHFYKYDIATDAWSRLADAPDSWGMGSDIVSNGSGTLYAARGISTPTFWKYNISSNMWDDTMAGLPDYQIYTTNGHALVYMSDPYGSDPEESCTSGCLYATRGNGNTQFFKYDIGESQWSNATDILTGYGPHYGGAMAYDPTTGYIFMQRGYNTDDFLKFNVSAETWDTLIADTPDAPATIYGGGSLVRFGNYLYSLRGNNRPEFWRYDITHSHWDSISTPNNVGNAGEDGMTTFVPNLGVGSNCDSADGCLFIAQGENTTNFWKYDLSAHTWSTLAVVSGAVQEGGSFCYNGADYIYALRGNNTVNFYRYTISTDTWGGMPSIPTTHSGSSLGARNAYYGADITCMGTTVYATKGYQRDHFYSFDGSSWSEETVSPYATYYGAALTNNGTYVYGLMGDNRNEFHRYEPGVGWTAMAPLPTSTYYSADLVYDGTNYIYAISGNYEAYFWRYDIAANAWTRSIDFPEQTNGYGASMGFDTTNDILYATRGFNTTSVYKADMTNNAYADSATWISDTLDLKWVNSFTTFAATHPTPGASSVTFDLRSSTDQVTWSAWETIVSADTGASTSFDMSGVTTPNARYVQVKVTLTSDGSNTPTLSDFTITYEKDSDNPTNPTATGYSDSSQGTGITTGNSYYYPSPYFSLSGATDASSGVAGYYVQWTDNASVDPSLSEDYYQTGTDFQVNTDMVSGTTYYLRIVTKDNNGNTSAAASAFTYTYNGISPASTQTWTSRADFEAAGTVTSNVNTTAGSETNMTLSSIATGLWMDLPAVFSSTDLGLTGINITNGGSGYTSAPTITFSGGGGSGAAATSLLNTTAYNDSTMAFDGADTIFVLQSVNTKKFFKYSISNKTWSSLADITSTANPYEGTAITYVPNGTHCADAGGCVFTLVGNNVKEFMRYNVSANTWTTLLDYSGAAVVTTEVYYGGSLVWAGGDYLFATPGYNTDQFYRYSISGNSWVARSSPVQPFYYGASMTYVPHGTYCSDATGCIFATRGSNTHQFLRYDIGANIWTHQTPAPFWMGYGGTITYNNGYIYAARGGVGDDFFRYDIANETWDYLTDLPGTSNYGSSNGMVYDTNTDIIYKLRGYNEYSFYSYDVTNDKWLNAGLPHDHSTNGFYYGGLTYDGSDTMYIVRGNSTVDFYKYTISTASYERLMNTPVPMYVGSDIVYKNGKVYAAGSYNKDNESKMYVYDVVTNTWSNSTNTAPAWLGYGANLVDGGDGYIYTARGQSTNAFYRYQISSNAWDVALNTIPAAVYRGGCAVSDGMYIYQIRAQNTADIFRFNIGEGTWDGATTLADAPAGIYQTDACTYDGNDLIYVPRGTNSNTDFYVYSIGGDSWDTRSTNDEYWYYGALETGPNGILYGFRGYNTSAMTRYVPSSASTGFEQTGTWTSQVLDLGSAYGFGGLTINDSETTGTSIKYETRTCPDSTCSTDPAWVEVSNHRTVGTTDYYSIDSTVDQYFQIKATFASNQIYTPTIDDMTVSYYSDSTAPTNPASVSGYTDSSKGTGITTATWGSDTTPYFEWTASDNVGGIGVKGFYVYFGTDNTKDPISDAADPTNLAYVGGTNYYAVAADGTTGSWNALTQSASALTSDIYYLIIRTDDHNNNQASSSGTLFTYQLDILDPTTPTGLSASPAGYSSVDDFDFSWTASSDTGGSAVYQYCYKTDGADTCIPAASTSVTGLTSYQSRGNTFSVRSLDTAGNYSAYTSTTFYYSGPAPTAPASVTGSPVTTAIAPQEDTNSFAFSWTLPGTCLGQACDAADILRYCYTINELPSAENCGTNVSGTTTPSPDGGWTTATQTANRLLPAFSAATQQGLNTIYIVAADIINNIDYDNYTAEEYYFTSNAPGVPASAAATDTSDRATQKYSVVLTWDEPADAGSGVTGYDVYRCESDCASPDPVDDPPANYTNIATVNTLGYLDTGLDTLITYSYFARAAGTGGTQSGNSTVLEIKPEGKFKFAPTLSGQLVATPYIRSALIEWLTLNDQDQYGNTILHPASSFVEYGETTAYGAETGTSELVSEHEVTLTNLTPDTLYHIRAKWTDVDGNTSYSPDFEFTTKGAPSAPTNLVATPTSNTENSFAFSWDAPTDEGVVIAGYRYSVNNLPNEENSSQTTDTTIAAYDAATQQGINTFYVVAYDDTGNINYSNYAVVEFEAHTIPPGTPQAVTIVDSSDRDAKRYSITITWDPPEGYTLDDEVYYTIMRSTDGDTYNEIATITSTGYLDTGLDNTQEYFYQIKAKDKAQATSDLTTAVSKIPEGRYTQPPAITEGPAATPDSFAGTIAWRTERIASSFVDYGLKPDDLSEEQGSADQVASHEVKVLGLQPETTYYYQIKSIDVDENAAYSEVKSFKTLEAPRVLDVTISDVKLYDALVSWTTNKDTTAKIEYGTTTDYGLTFTDTSGSFATTHTVKLTNLTDGATYNLRIGGEDKAGNSIQSDNYTFQTLTFPEVSDVKYVNKSEGQTEVQWQTNVPTTSTVNYYADNISPKTQGNAALTKDHAVLLFGLADATRYTYVVGGVDEFGYEAKSNEFEFTTLEDTTPPEIFGVQSESNTIGSGEGSKIQIVVSWKSNEPTTSQVQFGAGLGATDFTNETDENAELVQDHLVVISDLAPAKTYQFKVVSRDKAGNETKSSAYTVLTSRKRDSFLQLIVTNLEQTFSWLGNIGGVFGG